MIFSAIFAKFKAYVYGGAAVAVLLLIAALWYQSKVIDRLKADNATLERGAEIMLNANAETAKAVTELKKERDKINATCAKKIADKDRRIDTLRKIDEAKEGHNAGTGAAGNEVAAAGARGGGNTVIALLNGMLPAEDHHENGVCKADSAGVTEGAALVSGDVLYCLDAVNARNLLKDFALCKGWALEAVDTIEGMR